MSIIERLIKALATNHDQQIAETRFRRKNTSFSIKGIHSYIVYYNGQKV